MSSSSSRLPGKTALVTGASRGIGRAIALRFAREGATVVAHYGSSEGEAASLVAEITAAGGRAHAVQTDLALAGAAATLLGRVDALLERETGSPHFDILVNNAAAIDWAPPGKLDEAAFERMFAVNVRALYFLTEGARSRLRDGGRVINVSSVVVQHAFPDIMTYSATKGAVDVYTRNFAALLGPRGITVNSLAPGATDTDMSGWLRTEEGAATARGAQALPRIGRPADIADVAAFLASDDARWITGTVVEASGGWRL